MKSVSAVLVLLARLASKAEAGTIEVATCDDLEMAAAATAIEDTIANISTSGLTELNCEIVNDEGEGEVRSFTIESHVLTLEAPNDVETLEFQNVRFNLTNSGELLVSRDAYFRAGDDINPLEVDGGFMYVGEDSKAHFQGNLRVFQYQTRSATNGADFALGELFGGCLMNNGYFRVEGRTIFASCDNSGGGESPPGDGGAVFNGDTGSILFTGGVEIQDTFLTDNEGGNGAGIYNLGKVNIKGNSVFDTLFADTQDWAGGAIFNGEGAQFTFRNKAAAAFIDNGASIGSAVYNMGDFRFSGPAMFARNTNTVIENRSPGFLRLTSDSSFWLTETEGERGAVVSYLGATLDFPDDLVFEGLEGTTTDCDHINVETEDGFDCFS